MLETCEQLGLVSRSVSSHLEVQNKLGLKYRPSKTVRIIKAAVLHRKPFTAPRPLHPQYPSSRLPLDIDYFILWKYAHHQPYLFHRNW